MSLTADILAVFGAPQWSFVYHLIVLIAIEAGLGMAYGYWQRTRRREAHRLVWGLAGLLVLRLAPLLLSLFPDTLVNPQALLPPIELALDTIALALIGWTFVLSRGALSRPAQPFLWINIALVTLAVAALTRFWLQDLSADLTLSYGLSWQRYIWAAWRLLLCVGLAYAVIRVWQGTSCGGILLSIFAIIGLSEVLQIVVPLATGYAVIWSRLTNLLVYPLLAVIVYRQSLEQAALGQELLALPAAAGNPTETLLSLLSAKGPAEKHLAEDAERMAAGDPQVLTAIRAVGPMARALGAEQAAIGLLEEGKDDRMRLVAIYNPQRKGRGEAVSFPLDEQLAIRRALRRQELVQATNADDVVQLKFLYALMGSAETGPVLVQPLIYDSRPIGALIAGNGSTKRPFSDSALRLAPQLADVLATLLAAPKLIARLDKELKSRDEMMPARESEWKTRLDAMESELQQERENVRLFAVRMAELERESQQKDAELERLGRRLAQQEDDSRRGQQEAAALSKKLEALTRQKMDLEDEVRRYRDQIADLEQLLKESRASRQN
jgi:GAF domain-containing protein